MNRTVLARRFLLPVNAMVKALDCILLEVPAIGAKFLAAMDRSAVDPDHCRNRFLFLEDNLHANNQIGTIMHKCTNFFINGRENNFLYDFFTADEGRKDVGYRMSDGGYGILDKGSRHETTRPASDIGA